MINLANLIEQANELAPLPASTVRLAGLVSNPSCDLDDVAELIVFDQALTLRLLRVANSAASSPEMPVGDVKNAVIRMGMAQVLALAVAAGAKPVLQARVSAYSLDEGALWRHSVAAATAAETMQAFISVAPPPETFTAALLHDVGKLVMGRFLSDEILGFIRRAQEVDHMDRLDAESLLLDVNHAELGGLIAQHWKLPQRVVQGITYHHHPERGQDVICDCVHLANQVAKRIEAGLDGREYELSILPEVAERLGLTKKVLDDLCPIAALRYTQVRLRYDGI
jgi:putative nucleotidyltransferase with HDIG domain